MADNQPAFLADLPLRPWEPQGAPGLSPAGLFVGAGANAVEIVAARASAPPTNQTLLNVWKARRGSRAAPVLLVVLHPEGASLCGASGEMPPVYENVDPGQAERLCREALAQPDRHAALRFLAQALRSLETELPGLNNEGLLALHELKSGAPGRPDWVEAGRKASAATGAQGQDILTALGFQVEPLDNLTLLLRGGERRAALAVMLRETETPEAGTPRFNNLSPVSYALAKADAEGLPWVMMVQGSSVRLYSTSVSAGVGRRGRTETWVECQIPMLSDEHLAYLWLLCSAEALAPKGSLQQLLESSQRFSGSLADELRARIYNEVVPLLAEGVAAARGIENPGPQELAKTYEMALTVLFRLLFIAYAEDRDLLPYRFHGPYRRRSLKQKAQELAEIIAADTPVAEGDNHWRESVLLWDAVASGNNEWRVPAYNGGLFTNNADVSPAGAELAQISVPNATFELALRALLVTRITPEGVPGPVDFRALGVREFGTIYEGLLESELALADDNLTVSGKGAYMPANGKDRIDVPAGKIYLHNRSGVRKSSGSYYTKPFAVEHLLDGALEPALANHFARLGTMNDTDAAEAFFDFRAADIAMGSGHFLIAAIDRIEKGMADYLTKRNLPGVQLKLATLRDSAVNGLGDLAATVTIEDSQLLRRMIARRCIYGVDLNSLTVQLARLAVWIHTFVPGLPLSVLDHNLVHGNALVGIGTIDDIRSKFEETDETLFAVDADNLLGAAAEPLRRLANINDATLDDIAASRAAHKEAREAVSMTEALCDLITAAPISNDKRVVGFQFENWSKIQNTAKTARTVEAAHRDIVGLHPLHFPVAFPEVFLRDRPGFDVIIGNPPWEKVKTEEHEFWARHFPGLRGLSQRAREAEIERLRRERLDLVTLHEAERAETEAVRKTLTSSGAYPGMGTGDPDLYKAFCWRFWHLTAADGGHISVVLPRSALSAKGSGEFRFTVFNQAASVDITTLLNSGRWAFEMEPRYTIGLVCIAHGPPEEQSIRLRGPYSSLDAFSEGVMRPSTAFTREQVLSWNDSAALPMFPSEYSVEVFAKLRESHQLDFNEEENWRARPARNETETKDRNIMDLESVECPDGFWPIYKGLSFDIWSPDTGRYYAWANPNEALPWLFEKRLNSHRGGMGGPHGEFSSAYVQNQETLAPLKARVAFRDVTNRTNQRTLVACLIPPRVFVTEKALFFLWPRGDERDQAFLLGILSSIPMDWYARRIVEIGVKFYLMNTFPVPRPARDNPGWRRVVELAGRLACPDDRFADWAEAVGVDCGPLEADEKEDMIHELDAVVAHLYGLSEAHLTHIFETFHTGWDYQPRLGAVLNHYRTWAGRN